MLQKPLWLLPLAVRTTAPPCVRTGLLKKQEGGKPAFPALKRAFRLLVEGVDDRAPTDIAFAYSGYAPLLVRCGGPSHSADGPAPPHVASPLLAAVPYHKRVYKTAALYAVCGCWWRLEGPSCP